MPEVAQEKQSWSGLICPVCRFVFRVPLDHKGSGVVCPACAHLLQIPSAEQRKMAISARLRKPKDSYSAYRKIPDSAQQKDPTLNLDLSGEKADLSAPPLSSVSEASDTLDRDPTDDFYDEEENPQDMPAWEQEGLGGVPEPINATTWILSGSLLGVSIVAVSIWLIIQSVGVDVTAQKDSLGPSEEVPAPVAPAKNPDQVKEQKVDRKRIIRDAELLATKFLETKTESDLEQLIRTPEISTPRLRAWYARDPWVKPGLRNIDSNRVDIEDGIVTMEVKLNDYTTKKLSLEQSAKGFLVDWESWVAWSSVMWEDLFDLRPTKPVEVRVKCKRVNYYNRFFNDDFKWFAVTLTHPDFDRAIYGYIDRGQPQFHRFMADLVRESEVLATLKISYPENSVADNQVAIIEHVQTGWVRPVPVKKGEENIPSR